MELVNAYVPVSAVFAEVSSDVATLKSLVRSLSRTDALFWCARLNLVLTSADIEHLDAQHFGVLRFFNETELERINNYLLERQEQRATVFFRGQLLELARWVCLLSRDLSNDGNTFEDAEVRRCFAKAALIASDVWAQRIYGNELRLTDDRKLDRKRLMSIGRQAIMDNAAAPDLSRTLTRGVSIYNRAFHEALPAAEAEFHSIAGLSLDEYLRGLGTIAAWHFDALTDKTLAKPVIFSLKEIEDSLNEPAAKLLKKCIDLDSQTSDDLSARLSGSDPADGFTPSMVREFEKALRYRPVLRTSDGRGIMIDAVYFAEKASVGPLFLLVRNTTERREANPIFGAFGRGFEDYVGSLLESMYPQKGELLSSRLSRNPMGTDQAGNIVELADACLNDVSEVVLFEAKATFLRDDIPTDGDPNAYASMLRSKYAAFNQPNQRDQGAGQLARNILKLAEGTLVPNTEDFSRARTICPVLVVYDKGLNAPGHAEFLADEFADLVAVQGVSRNGFVQLGAWRVAPLTVLTIDDLENLQSSIEYFRLVDILLDYAGTTVKGARLSFSDFCALSQTKYRFIHSKELAERALSALDRMRAK